MCEVQEPGGAPGSGSHRGASPPPERLSVSSSGAEEDTKTPRDSLLSHSDEGLKGETPEGTSSSRKESGDIEASELSPRTSRKIVDEEKRDDEEEVEKEKVERETMGEDENVKEESEGEAIDVKDCVCDESERENQENERRDELAENALKMEKDIEGAKTVDNSAEEEEENRRGNDEAASKSDSPKAEEAEKQEEDVGKQINDEEEKDNRDKHEVDEKKNKEREEKTVEEEEKGVDPSRPKETTNVPITRKVSKTVNFLDNELKKHIENKLSKRNTINSTSSSSSFKSKEEEEEEEEEDDDDDVRDVKDEDRIGKGEVEEKNGRHWPLGEGNPVYRLSLKLSPNLFNTTDIPGANQHKEAEKTGFLTKLSGRSFPYIAQWKRRYCVLSKGRLYYYEREDSKAGDKSNGVIQLEYFDQVAEAGPKECKKATNVFVITSQDRSFFDPGRHLFSADTLPDMKDWIRRLQEALDQIRNNNRPAASTSPSASPSTQDGGKRRRDEAAESKDSKGSQTHIGSNKEKKKKKEESGRARKSSRVGISNETQTSMVEPMTCEVDGVRPAMAAPKGGVILPGFSSRKDLQATSKSVQRREEEIEAEDGLPRAGPTLPSVTKQRVKGPSGRRAPQNHRRAAAAALKKRASSLSALEHQDVNDNSEAPWLNRSLDVLEGGNPWGRKQVGAAVPCKDTPYKAYTYSSDEDDMDDDHSGSFPASASASEMPPPPPPPPRSASYRLELRSASQGGTAPGERLEPRRSLSNTQGSQGDLMGSRDSLGGWRGSRGQGWEGSRGSLGQNGRASPVMDDLDNLLMNQSVQHSSAALDSVSDAGSEGSSTCRATDHQQPPPAPDHCIHHHHHSHSHQQAQQPRKKSQDLSRFTTAVRHLQRHVVEIDRAVFAMTGDVAGTRREVAALREAVAGLQADADTITTTLSNLTQEAITAQQKISFATQVKWSGLPLGCGLTLTVTKQQEADTNTSGASTNLSSVLLTLLAN